MYELAVSRDFVAQHYLTVPSPPPGEGEPHSHHYDVEVRFTTPELGAYGYVVDIDDVEATLEALVDRYRDELLNDLPEFGDDNPSVERFAARFGDRVASGLTDDTPTELTVRIWEDDVAWASHSREL